MLTKSDFLKYIQCSKYLWLNKHRKDLIPKEVDENLQKVFDNGYLVESYACNLFPEGINAQVDDFNKSIANTKKLMVSKFTVIFQPTISANELFCRADIIKFNKESEGWDIYEVKSSTEVKDINIYDLAFQKICFEGMNYKVNKLYLVFVNNQYIRKGDIYPKKLLCIEDVTETVKLKEDEVKLKITEALDIIKQNDEPNIRILKQCEDPYGCTFIPYCWKNVPDNSIYSIAGGLSEDKLNKLLDDEILQIKDIPDGIITSVRGLRHYNVVKQNKVHIELENIKEELSQLQYPLYFIDYETNSPTIPLFDGYRPYQRMTFQYSLHIQQEPGGKLEHYAYLAEGWKDPSLELAKDLKNRVGKVGSFISWNMSFEKGCNSEMGERYPEYKSFFEDINNRMFDLMQIFKKGYYVHKDFCGSASIKKVLPVLVPELSYSDLTIHEGSTASNKWRVMIDPETSKKESKEIYNNLLEYCKLDTLAMVEILNRLYKELNK